ncbi:PBSX family phage terminase large subunit [Streptomyces olivaceus]|uniref:PBSX family phage terminase large subunit n=1 Tax=Streptomyces olivaceus TaxID=47716 RepID=UPI001CCC18C4|nr:PBSX family phage terminase large subunit [Streptomyces olivaceus]MBZ6207535.1 PBSX family phage terminase large subunit [Streptomyces olivaceus]
MSPAAIDLPLSRKQIDFIGRSTARINLAHGSVRSGKSIAVTLAFFIAVSRAPASGLILCVGRSLATIERNVLEPMQDPELFGPLASQVIHTRGATTAIILGRTVHLVGAADARSEGRLRGLTACLAMADELTLLPEAFVKQLLGRLSVPNAQLYASTNPDGPSHWVRRDFLAREDELDMRSWHFTLKDNPSLTPEYIESLSGEYTGLWRKRFLEGLWVAAEGAIYDMWDEDRHVVDTVPQIHRWVAVGVDYGITNAFAAVLLGLGTDRRLYAASEWRYDARHQRRQLTDVEYSERLRGWLRNVPGIGPVRPQFVTVDPSAASFIQQLKRDRLTPTPANNSVLDGIRTVSSLLATDRLKVHSSCRGLIAEISGYAWDDKAAEKGEDKPIKAADHSCDALRYGVFTTRPLWQQKLAIAA